MDDFYIPNTKETAARILADSYRMNFKRLMRMRKKMVYAIYFKTRRAEVNAGRVGAHCFRGDSATRSRLFGTE